MEQPTPIDVNPAVADGGSPVLPGVSESPVSVWRKIFFNSAELRAGWRLLIYIALSIAIGFALVYPLGRWHPQRTGLKMTQGLLEEFGAFLALVLAAYVMSRFEKRRPGQYGLPRDQAFCGMFWVGAVWGFLWLTVLLLVMRALGAFYFGHLAIHGLNILKFGGFYALVFLVVGFFEEFLMRGYTQYTLTTGIGFWPAAILFSTLFGAAHAGNKGEAIVGLVAAALIGLFFCLTLRRTGSLWFAVGFHMSWDWGESFFYSTPDSGGMSPGHLLNSSFHGSKWITGGSVGPEGSLLVLLVIALMWIGFDRVYRQVQYPDLRRYLPEASVVSTLGANISTTP